MREYQIAFFTADWNYDLVESTLHGLKRFVQDHENVRLRIFECFGKEVGTSKDQSEYGIFELADLSRFDGLLIQGNQIVYDQVRDVISRRIVESGIPALTIDCPMEGCAMLGIDNRAAQREIVNHVIRTHAARHVVYITGILEQEVSEGQQRMAGFLDACRENGLKPEEYEIIEGTWRPEDGMNAAARWVREGRPLPDAFVCGNDEMALGLIEELEKHGYRVPRDVLVTGFDNITSAELSTPRLSTVRRNYDRMNYTAMKYLLDIIDGRETRGFIPYDYEPIYSESCGCSEVSRPAYIQDKYFQQTRFLKHFYTLQDQMAQALFDAANMPLLMDEVEDVNRVLGCDSVCVCINDHYFNKDEVEPTRAETERFGREMILAACGMGDLVADENHVYTRFPTAELLPKVLMDRERFLIFYPLHYNTYSIGYLVMNDISAAAKLNLHESVFSFLDIAIENVRKKVLLRRLNEELNSLYVHDALTGLYNRFGFERYAKQTYDAFLRKDGGAQVLFVDMDDMKGVNDRYGHESGDSAICAAARVLRSICNEDDFLMRYGGDEFLMIVSRKRENIVQDVGDAVKAVAQSEALPFRLSLSVGVVPADPGRTLDQCIQEADARMYRIKRSKKPDGT